MIFQSKDFYRQIAEISKNQFYSPILDENNPYHARLTEKSDIDSITTEDGDLFNWLKDQAKKGVVSAQVS